MKNLFLLFSLVLSFSSCSKNEEEKINDNSVVGTWKLIEIYSSDGGSSPKWNQINMGYTYTFYSNGVIKSSKFDCEGKYTLNVNNSVHIEFGCNISKINGNFDFMFVDDNLIFIPNPNTCYEGCKEKFMKIEE